MVMKCFLSHSLKFCRFLFKIRQHLYVMPTICNVGKSNIYYLNMQDVVTLAIVPPDNAAVEEN